MRRRRWRAPLPSATRRARSCCACASRLRPQRAPLPSKEEEGECCTTVTGLSLLARLWERERERRARTRARVKIDSGIVKCIVCVAMCHHARRRGIPHINVGTCDLHCASQSSSASARARFAETRSVPRAISAQASRQLSAAADAAVRSFWNWMTVGALAGATTCSKANLLYN